MAEQRYVPAAGRSAFTPLYDRAMAVTMRESRWRRPLADEVLKVLPDGAVVLDVGCGTGTQAIELGGRVVHADVVGVDGDEDALRIAKGKVGAGRVRWVLGTADSLPMGDESVDRVIVSLLLHHLEPTAKAACLAECRRVLRPEGTLHVVDWGRPRGAVPTTGFQVLRMLDGRTKTQDHADGRVPALVVAAGFADVRVTQVLATVFGTLERLRAARTPSDHQPRAVESSLRRISDGA